MIKCRKILVIEPDAKLRNMLGGELRSRKFDIAFAENAGAALDYLLANKLPDILLLELNLPGMNGWEFLALQKSTPRISGIPTLVYSEGPALGHKFTGRYLEKRPDFSELMESLERICAENEEKADAMEKGEASASPADEDPQPELIFPNDQAPF